MALPAREPGDTRMRIGCVHGCTFDIEGYQTNFPICRDAGVQRGLDYLAIGDTHSFRDVTAEPAGPDGLPGRPGADQLRRARRRHRGPRRAVPARLASARGAGAGGASGAGSTCAAATSNELRTLLTTPDLDRHVVRLHLDMTVSLAEESEVERILRDLQGTDATHGRAGVLLVDRTNLRLQPGSAGAFPDDLPPVVQDTIARLGRLARIAEDGADEAEKSKATRALAHLYKLLQSHERADGTGAMKLHRLRVENFAAIGEADIEFGPGLNVLYGPNDLGKSTLADAIRLALLLPHTSTHIDPYVPWTGGQDPVVELTFETEAQRIWRVRKEFRKGGSPCCRSRRTAWTSTTSSAPGKSTPGSGSFCAGAFPSPEARVREGLSDELPRDRAAVDPSRRDRRARRQPAGRPHRHRQGADRGGAASGGAGPAVRRAAPGNPGPPG